MYVNWDNIVSNTMVIEPDISALLHQKPTTRHNLKAVLSISHSHIVSSWDSSYYYRPIFFPVFQIDVCNQFCVHYPPAYPANHISIDFAVRAILSRPYLLTYLLHGAESFLSS